MIIIIEVNEVTNTSVGIGQFALCTGHLLCTSELAIVSVQL